MLNYTSKAAHLKEGEVKWLDTPAQFTYNFYAFFSRTPLIDQANNKIGSYHNLILSDQLPSDYKQDDQHYPVQLVLNEKYSDQSLANLQVCFGTALRKDNMKHVITVPTICLLSKVGSASCDQVLASSCLADESIKIKR
jgi:hypothetical protein